MKQSVLFVLLVSSCIFCQGQETDRVMTEAEELGLKSGTLIKAEFFDIGSVKDIEMRVLKITDLHSGSSMSALQLQMSVQGRYTTSTKTASLDVEEIDDFILAIRNLRKHVFPITPRIYTEVKFRSKTGFEAGAFYNEERQRWETYLKLERNDADSMAFLSIADFDQLLTLIESSKQQM